MFMCIVTCIPSLWLSVKYIGSLTSSLTNDLMVSLLRFTRIGFRVLSFTNW
jgi:hypothetical protein